jgi:hypothetical protein
MTARDAGWTPKRGLEVYDKDGQKVGYVDEARDAQGWMQVEALGLGLQRLWIPHWAIKSVDDREVMVTLARDEVHAGCGKPSTRNTQVVHRDGAGPDVKTSFEMAGRREGRATLARVSGRSVSEL